MKYYASFWFTKSDKSQSAYILEKSTGEVPNLHFPAYTDGKQYVRFTTPRNERLKKFFAYTFELSNGQVLSSVERLDDKYRTFGDAKQIGLNDLILFQFSPDMKRMVMWFVRNQGFNKETKQTAFRNWTRNRERLLADD